MRKIRKLTLKATFNFMKIWNVSFPLQFTVNSFMFWCNSIKTNKKTNLLKKQKTKTPNIWKPEWQHKNARNSKSSNGHSWMVLKVGQSQVKTCSFTELKKCLSSMVQIKLFPFITTALIVGAGRGCLDWHLATSVLLFPRTEFGLSFLLTIL